MAKTEYGYHKTFIPKGEMGSSSKIMEEILEIQDAEKQGIRIMVHCEIADLYGALEAFAHRHGLTMKDVRRMSRATSRAFRSGHRK